MQSTWSLQLTTMGQLQKLVKKGQVIAHMFCRGQMQVAPQMHLKPSCLNGTLSVFKTSRSELCCSLALIK